MAFAQVHHDGRDGVQGHELHHPGARDGLGRRLAPNGRDPRVDSSGPEGHIKVRILHSGYKAQDKRNSGNHGLEDPHICVAYRTLDRSRLCRRHLKGKAC